MCNKQTDSFGFDTPEAHKWNGTTNPGHNVLFGCLDCPASGPDLLKISFESQYCNRSGFDYNEKISHVKNKADLSKNYGYATECYDQLMIRGTSNISFKSTGDIYHGFKNIAQMEDNGQ